MLRDRLVGENTHTWRAQVLIVANERDRKRLVVDYRTIY